METADTRPAESIFFRAERSKWSSHTCNTRFERLWDQETVGSSPATRTIVGDPSAWLRKSRRLWRLLFLRLCFGLLLFPARPAALGSRGGPILPYASPDFCVIVFVEGLEKGGGEAVNNMPVAWFSARGKVPQPGQKPSEITDSRGVLQCLCLCVPGLLLRYKLHPSFSEL